MRITSCAVHIIIVVSTLTNYSINKLNAAKSDNPTNQGSTTSSLDNWHYVTKPTAAGEIDTHNAPPPVIAYPPSNYQPSKPIHAPCSSWSSKVNNIRQVYDRHAGVAACKNLCNHLYRGKKFGKCISLVGCRCFSRRGRLYKWLKDFSIEPLDIPTGIAFLEPKKT